MIENVPPYVSVLFLLTTFAALGIFIYGVRVAGRTQIAAKWTSFILALWIAFQSLVSYSGSYLSIGTMPPLIFVVGIVPSILLLVTLLFLWSRSVPGLSLRILTAIHIVRIPVEIVLFQLGKAELVSGLMTFEGVNFDIVTGFVAIAVLIFGFRKGEPNRPALIAFNIFGLCMVTVVVAIGILSVPGPIQSLGFETPNIAVLYFPYAFLPTVVVPIILFAHIETLRQLFASKLTNRVSAA